MKILITDGATVHYGGDLSLDIFKSFGEVDIRDLITREELLDAVCDVDIILCNKTVIDGEVMEKAPNLKYIGLFATGYNNIDIAAARARGITVCNAGSYSTSAVAQQVFGYILNHFSAVSKFDSFVKQGGWINSPTFSCLCFPTDELADKAIGIIGYGSIGRRVAEIALAFEMKVLVHTRTPKHDPRVSFVSFDELLQSSDIVTVHCPLNDQSREMFNNKAFAKMKRGAYFINTARGGVLNEQALFDALKSGRLSGAAVDVLESEPMTQNCVLKSAPSITITPHTAWAPLATRKRLLGIVAGNISAFLDGKPMNKII